MALLVLMLPAGADARLHPQVMTDLARLGVTSLAIVRDDRSIGVVVEGWGFDPTASADGVLSAICGRNRRARTLRPVMEMTLTQGEQ
jgi:hypothetical protein